MTTGRRHLTRRDMKGDEFVSWVTQATIWVEQNSRTVVIAMGVAAAIVVVAIGGYTWIRSRQDQAFTRLGEVQKIARMPLAGDPGAGPGAFGAPEERASRVVEAADRMLQDFPSGTAAGWARYERAAALLELRRFDEAASTIDAVMGSSSGTLLADMSRLLAGRIEEARGNHQRAADLYGTAAASASGGFPPELALFDQARCLDTLGKKQDAINVYQKIADVYPDSPLASKANQKLQQLRGSAQGL